MVANRNKGWQTAKLGDVIELFDHKRVPLNSRERRERQGPYPYYGAQGIIDHIDDYRFDGRYILVAEDGENLNSRKLPLAMFADGKFWVNNHAHVLRGKAEVVDDRFLFSCLNHADIKPYVTGAAQPKLSQANLRLIEIPRPPLPVQRKIAGILSAYDDLIENGTRRIRILEEMARAICREWFVHFRFPGHEKTKLVSSPLGPIPQGWQLESVGDVAETFRGRSYRSGDLADEGGLPFINLKCLDRDGGFRRSGLKRYIGEYKNSHIARKGDIVVAVTDMTQERRIVARAAWVPTLDNDCGVFSMDLLRIEPKAPLPKTYFYCFLRFSGFADEVKQRANGVNVLHLSPDCVRQYRFAVPPSGLASRFARFVGPALDVMDTLENQIANLRRTRDLLLPKLISGEVDVSELDIKTGGDGG